MALKALSAVSFLLLLSFTTATSTSCPPPPASPPPAKPSCDPCKRSPAQPSCPRDALKLGVCADVLHLLKVKVGTPPKYPCCSLISGLVDLEAAVCLCTAVKASILGINLNIPVDLTLLLNFCGKSLPPGFTCA